MDDEAVVAAVGKWKHARPGQIARELDMSTQAVTAALYRNYDKVSRNAQGWWSGRLKAHVMVPQGRLLTAGRERDEALAAVAGVHVDDPPTGICGVICAAGPNGEPLACAYPRDHEGVHSWATLPTFGGDDA